MSKRPTARAFTDEDARRFRQAMHGDTKMLEQLDRESRASVTARPGENEHGFVPGEVKALQDMFPADGKEGGRKKRRSRKRKSCKRKSCKRRSCKRKSCRRRH
jgi:hypothetical protein